MKSRTLVRTLLLAATAWTSVPVAYAQTSATPLAPPSQWWLQDAEIDGVPGIGAERAYRELLAGREPKARVVVAIIDSGIDIGHEDLRGVLWINEDEIAGNGLDDDRNGYVDDIHGWNFIGGADGRHVDQDTYEVTRLYAVCQAAVAPGRPGAGPPAAECQEIRAEFGQKRAETAQMLNQLAGIEAAVARITALLEAHLGTDSLTPASVSAIQSPRPEVMQAKQIYLQLAAAEVTPEQIGKEKEALEKRLEFGFNPDFDPRSIVGDDPANRTERGYGNADVFGPSAEHGTHVAGIAAATRGNGLGIQGIAPNARIMVIRAVPDGDERDKDIANAIRYAVDNGARVVNMSFGKAYSPDKRLVDDAVRYADSKGVLLVHAAGNDGADLRSERNFPNRAFEGGGEADLWIEVGASAPSLDSLAASFSNYGSGRVDVFAPGVRILSSVPANAYESNQGTSMAAPVVTGLAALILSYYPEFSAAEVRQIILDSASPHRTRSVVRPGDDGGQVAFGELSTTGGVVNAYAALKLAEERSRSTRD